MEYKYIKYKLKYLNLLNIMQKGSSLSPEQTEINKLFYHLLYQTNIITDEISSIINNITEILMPYEQIIIIDSLNFASIEQDEERKLYNIKNFINTNYDKIIKWFNDNLVPIYYLHLFYNLITQILIKTEAEIKTEAKFKELDEANKIEFDKIKKIYDENYKNYYETKHKIESVKNLILYYDNTDIVKERKNRNDFIKYFNDLITKTIDFTDEINEKILELPKFTDKITKDNLSNCRALIKLINKNYKIKITTFETSDEYIKSENLFKNYIRYILSDLEFNTSITKIICNNKTLEFISIMTSLLLQIGYSSERHTIGFLIIHRTPDSIETYEFDINNKLFKILNILIINIKFNEKNIKYKEIDDYFVLIFKYLFYKLDKQNTITISGDNYGWTANLTFIQETHDNFNFINRIKNVNKINPDNFIEPFISTYYRGKNPDDEKYHIIRIRDKYRSFDDFYVRNFDSEKNVFSYDIINETGRHPIKPIIISKRHSSRSPAGHSSKRFRR
jgi:hypothetical protein